MRVVVQLVDEDESSRQYQGSMARDTLNEKSAAKPRT